MNGLLKIQAEYKGRRKSEIPPFWRFFFRNFLIEFNKGLNGLFKNNTEVNLIDYHYKEISDDFLHLNNIDNSILIKPINIFIFFNLTDKDANSLISKMYGGDFTSTFDRKLTNLNKTQLKPFFELIKKYLNQSMEDAKRDMEFDWHTIQFFSGEVLCLNIQIDFINLEVLIPVNLFKPTLIQE